MWYVLMKTVMMMIKIMLFNEWMDGYGYIRILLLYMRRRQVRRPLEI